MQGPRIFSKLYHQRSVVYRCQLDSSFERRYFRCIERRQFGRIECLVERSSYDYGRHLDVRWRFLGCCSHFQRSSILGRCLQFPSRRNLDQHRIAHIHLRGRRTDVGQLKLGLFLLWQLHPPHPERQESRYLCR